MAATTAPPPKEGGDFFDDDNNKAMYLVLPAMILIYGSCCLIYCVHKGRRYCINKSKKKQKAERKRLVEKKRRSFDNPGLNIQDEHPHTSGRQSSNGNTVILTLESLENDHHQGKGVSSRRSQETDVDSLVDVLQAETVSGVAPGYAGASLSQEMQHLDNQLKAAFRLTNNDVSKSTQKPETSKQQDEAGRGSKGPQGETRSELPHEAVTAYINWKALQKSQPPKLEVKYTATGDTVVVRIPKEKRLKMVQNNESAANSQKEDITAMMAVRESLNKEVPKSMPDILRRPDENQVVLKKASADKRRIYLSPQ